MGRLVRKHGFFGDHVEIPVRLDEPQPHAPRYLRLGLTCLLCGSVNFGGQGQAVQRENPLLASVPQAELQDAVTVDGVKAMPDHQWLQGRARIRHLFDGKTPDIAIKPVRAEIGKSRTPANLCHHGRQGPSRRPAIQPMSARVVFPIAPFLHAVGKEGIGPRVEGPDKGPAHVQHPPLVFRGQRIVFRRLPVLGHRDKVLHLHQFIPRAGGMVRQQAFRAFAIQKLVRLVRALVDRGTAVLGEPDRFFHRLPGGRHRRALAVDPVVVKIRPPASDVLVPEHPWFKVGAICDRRADLCRAGLWRVIKPVIALAALDVGLEVVKVVDAVPVLPVQMTGRVAPIGERHVIVDADEVDVRIGPKRIEMKPDIVGSVLGMIAEILGPIRRIADLGLRPEYLACFRRERPQLLDRDKDAARPAELGQPTHLRSDAERLHPTGLRAKHRVVQDEPRERPVCGLIVVDHSGLFAL